MTAWMMYVTAMGVVVGLAALLAEGGLRRLGRPVRWVWLGALVATVGIPALVLGLGAAGAAPPVGAAAGGGAGAPMGGLVLLEPSSGWFGSRAAGVVLLAVWVVVSLVLLVNLRLSAWTLQRNARQWRLAMVEGRPAAVSAGFGPGVVGVARPRIVLPIWALDGEHGLLRLMALHEAEHVRAGDTRLLLGGLILVALVPWCLPLWWQLHRLRSAIETDCDARVLAGTGSRRAYARALVAVAGRRQRPGPLSVPALGPGQAELERRIRLITRARAGGADQASGRGRLVAAAGLVAGLAAVPAPRSPDLDFRAVPAATWPSAEYASQASTIVRYSIDGGAADSMGGGGAARPATSDCALTPQRACPPRQH